MKEQQTFGGAAKTGESILGPWEKRFVSRWVGSVPKWLSVGRCWPASKKVHLGGLGWGARVLYVKSQITKVVFLLNPYVIH